MELRARAEDSPSNRECRTPVKSATNRECRTPVKSGTIIARRARARSPICDRAHSLNSEEERTRCSFRIRSTRSGASDAHAIYAAGGAAQSAIGKRVSANWSSSSAPPLCISAARAVDRGGALLKGAYRSAPSDPIRCDACQEKRSKRSNFYSLQATLVERASAISGSQATLDLKSAPRPRTSETREAGEAERRASGSVLLLTLRSHERRTAVMSASCSNGMSPITMSTRTCSTIQRRVRMLRAIATGPLHFEQLHPEMSNADK